MMRPADDPVYPNMAMLLEPNGTPVFQSRLLWGNNTSQVIGSGSNQWVRIVRAGSTFTGYTSVDGVNWVQVGTSQTSTSMTGTLLVGLVSCAGDNTKLGVATFDNVSGLGAFQISAVPTGLAATAGNAGIALRWNASAGATGYNVKRAATSGGAYQTVASAINATSYIDSGLTNGTTYYYAVSAVNDAGESANSGQVNAAPGSGSAPTTAPGAVTVAAGNYTATLTWAAVSGATGYDIRRATASGGPYSLVASNVAATTYKDTSLSNGTLYYYVITAVNQNGESAPANEVPVMTGMAFGPPTNLAAQPAGNGIVALTWTSPGGTQSCRVKRATTSGGLYTTVASPRTASYTDSLLINGTPYYYVVSAINVGVEGPNSSQVKVTPVSPVPAAPPGLAGTAGNGQAILTWNPVVTSTSYNVRWASVTGGPYSLRASGIATPTYTDTGLANKTAYYYVVTAVNANGEGANSAEAQVIPTLPPISPGELLGPPISITSGSANLTVKASVSGRTYQLQRSDNLISWQNVGSVQTGTGGDLSLTALRDASVQKQFYRVLIGP
jgi:fibronectin type 3 domain-containing protein